MKPVQFILVFWTLIAGIFLLHSDLKKLSDGTFVGPTFSGQVTLSGAKEKGLSDPVIGWLKFNPLDPVPDVVMRVLRGKCSFAVKAVVVFRRDSGAHLYAKAHLPGPDSVMWCWRDDPSGELVYDRNGLDWTNIDAEYGIDLTGRVT